MVILCSSNVSRAVNKLKSRGVLRHCPTFMTDSLGKADKYDCGSRLNFREELILRVVEANRYDEASR
jgi:hypothetical protein